MMLRRLSLYVAAAGFAIGLNAYILFSAVMEKYHTNGKLSLADECDDPASGNVPAENPNKLLFVSCGGFEE